MKTVRCAIYTRKSSEEGLDQAFNSLDAQREAGLDYVKSQKREGWEAVKDHYDDGGFSGGTMKRPGLERLLADIDKGRVDVVVVYKVDRLSRSLGDFARMMQLFDEKKVSFVSVTQQFNTTTSMGRLTLNMLLSFAQFEREVAGERIRDKIAATKKQGYWVCGQPPLGYRLQREGEERGIYIVPEEAGLVRLIFEGYLESRSLVGVADALDRQGHTTKQWQGRSGRVRGGRPLTQKYIARTLTNPVYIGKVTHTRGGKIEVYSGRHEAIIDRATWDRVQSSIGSVKRDEQHRWSKPCLLQGKLRTAGGAAMSPTSVHRPLSRREERGRKRLVHYYISQQAIKQGFKTCPIKTINAGHLDDLVRGLVMDYAASSELDGMKPERRDAKLREVIETVTLSAESVAVALYQAALQGLQMQPSTTGQSTDCDRPTCVYKPEVNESDGRIVLRLPVQIKKLDGKRLLLSPEGRDLVIPSVPEPRQHIVDAIGLAYRWHDDMLRTAMPAMVYAEAHGVHRKKLFELLPLVQLGPQVITAALRGTLLPSVTLDDLFEAAKDPDWSRQAHQLGLPAARHPA